ncbi:MAG: putative rane protein [Cyanobacteria bacterium RYN_339]|nr:putative rane protein [Cyanobacteria bacterium RYN_339]
MHELGIAVALVSASTQALAHAMLKAGRDKLVIRGLIGVTCAVGALPVACLVPLPGAVLWPWLALAGALHATYQLVLIRAYEAADFAVAYPLARGIVPLASACVGVALLGDRLDAGAIAGVLAVTAGLGLVAGRARPVPAALLAGLLTTAYTVVDGHAVRLAPEAGTFIAWFFLVDGLIMGTLAACARRGRLPQLVRAEGRHGVLAGLASLLTYACALLALRWLPVGEASALRETSLVFGLALARWGLREQVGARRAAGAALVALGGALIVLA